MQTFIHHEDSKQAGTCSRKLTPAACVSRAFFVALALFFLVNLVLFIGDAGRAKRSPSEVLAQARQEENSGVPSKHSWSWWLARAYEEQNRAPDVVVFGSSLLGSAHAAVDAVCMQQSVDVLTHRRMIYLEDEVCKRTGQKLSIFSLGSPGEMISDYYVISKALFVPGKKPRLVIATIAPRDFIDSTLAYPAATEHYKFFSSYLDLAGMAKFAYPDFFARLGAEVDRLPLKRLSKLAISRHAESTNTDWNLSEASRVAPGQAIVPVGTVPERADNTKEYVQRFRNPSGANYACEMGFFRQWLAEMKEQGIAVTVVCMPTTASNRQLLPASFWQRFRSDVAQTCRANQADWRDLSDSGLFGARDYLDTVHLNAYGAVHLFPVIAEQVCHGSAGGKLALKPVKTASKVF
jgi:hypothetical protein